VDYPGNLHDHLHRPFCGADFLKTKRLAERIAFAGDSQPKWASLSTRRFSLFAG
jgi:hypothetical protein